MRKLFGASFFIPVIIVALVCLAGAFAAGPGGIDPNAYPEIGDKEMGQLRWILNIADQPIDDFSLIDEKGQSINNGRRYTIAFMTYFLALEQYHKLPACPGIIQPRFDRFIMKMIDRQTWEYWAEVSKGLPRLEPLLNRPYPEQHDPVADQNIMYSGHLGHMIGLYETLYRDMKWDGPGSIVFAWSEDEKYIYDNHSLQKVMHKQMKHWPNCIPCEPNACFPACNQHPVLSFILYDRMHGTDLAEVNDLYMDFFLERKLMHPRTHHVAAYYLVKQNMTVSGYDVGISASMDGWSGAFMHVWQPDFIERHYPYQKKDFIVWQNKRSARMIPDYGPGQSLKYGYFGTLAAEVGDIETRDKLLNYSEKLYKPRWDGPYFVYPSRKAAQRLESMTLTGKLIALARAGSRDGLAKMHNQPFEDDHFAGPRVVDVEFPAVVLRRAIFDSEKQALIVTTEPGDKKSGTTTFRVIQLDPDKTYKLMKDGKQAASYNGRSSIQVNVELDSRHDMVLAEI